MCLTMSRRRTDLVPTALRRCRVYGTHHIGASTQQARDAVAIEAAKIILNFVKFGVSAQLCQST